MSNLHQHIEQRHAELDLSMAGVYELFSSQKQYTRQVNRPNRLPLETLIQLSNRIQVNPQKLVNDYGASSDALHRYFHLLSLVEQVGDIAQLRAHYRIEPINALRDVQTITNHQLPGPKSP